MNLDKYDIETEINSTYFEFVSRGTQGSIVKVIKYSKISEDQEIYNLGFGAKNLTSGELDDKVISNNGDTGMVLATVASTLHEFFNEYPNAIVYSKGDSNYFMEKNLLPLCFSVIMPLFYHEFDFTQSRRAA